MFKTDLGFTILKEQVWGDKKRKRKEKNNIQFYSR